jgi:uncharacterized membrane protein
MLAAAEDNPGIPAGLIVLLIGGILIAFGYARAVFDRSNADYKKTKASLPGMRKDVWRALFRMLRIGFWVAIIGFVLVTWVVRDVNNTRTEAPRPSAPAKVGK